MASFIEVMNLEPVFLVFCFVVSLVIFVLLLSGCLECNFIFFSDNPGLFDLMSCLTLLQLFFGFSVSPFCFDFYIFVALSRWVSRRSQLAPIVVSVDCYGIDVMPWLRNNPTC